jgi:mono/diheme cytochrome c family protein
MMPITKKAITSIARTYCLHTTFTILLFVGAFASCLLAAGRSDSKDSNSKDPNASPIVRTTDADTMRIEGEQRFHANCGRCHAAPHKFPPRMMATVIRHMRVRATITDEDMRLVLFYMTQ